MTFIGREKELAELQSAVAGPDDKARVLVLTGRRRVGKTTLIEHFCASQINQDFYKLVGMPPVKGTTRATVELNNVALQIAETFKVPKPMLTDWEQALWTIARYVEPGNCVLFIDEINWFGKTHGDIAGALWILWEQKLKNIHGLTLILTGSLISWIKANVTESDGWYGRLSWNSVLHPLPLKEAMQFIPNGIKKRLTIGEQLRYFMVSGGIPRYIEEYDFSKSLEDNLIRLAWSKSGYFYREYDILMQDLFRTKGNKIKKILDALSDCRKNATEIARKINIQKPNGDLYHDLKLMEDCDFIRATHPWDLKDELSSTTNPEYRIVDPYLRFYYKAIHSQRKDIENGLGSVPENFDSILGFQFEHVMRENLALVCQALKLNIEDVKRAAPFQIKGLQIDLLIETKRYFYIVEFKFQRHQLGMDVVRNMEQKIEGFPCPANKSIRTALIHVNGAEEKVINSDAVDICTNIGELL